MIPMAADFNISSCATILLRLMIALMMIASEDFSPVEYEDARYE